MKMNIDDESKNSGYKFEIQSIYSFILPPADRDKCHKCSYVCVILDHPYIPTSACVKMIWATCFLQLRLKLCLMSNNNNSNLDII